MTVTSYSAHGDYRRIREHSGFIIAPQNSHVGLTPFRDQLEENIVGVSVGAGCRRGRNLGTREFVLLLRGNEFN